MNPGGSWVALLALGLVLSGCGSTDDGSGEASLSQAAIQSFEGTYELTAFTENRAGCDSEGTSTFASKQDRSFVMVGAEALGTRFIRLASCADAADCAAIVTEIRNLGSYGFEYGLTFSSQAAPDQLAGFEASSGFLENGVCTRRDYTTFALTREGDTIRSESRLIPLANASPEDDFCWAEPAKQRSEAKGRPCAELTVISGRKVGPLP